LVLESAFKGAESAPTGAELESAAAGGELELASALLELKSASVSVGAAMVLEFSAGVDPTASPVFFGLGTSLEGGESACLVVRSASAGAEVEAAVMSVIGAASPAVRVGKRREGKKLEACKFHKIPVHHYRR
jgi:hypothetical protein